MNLDQSHFGHEDRVRRDVDSRDYEFLPEYFDVLTHVHRPFRSV
jgi:hypothetical protein